MSDGKILLDDGGDPDAVGPENPLPTSDTGVGLIGAGWHYGFVDTPETDYILRKDVGGEGDFLRFLTIMPLSASPGDVYLTNGDGDPELVYDGSLAVAGVPVRWDVEANSQGGPWTVTLTADVKVSFTGKFT